jgi:hypothetical protein
MSLLAPILVACFLLAIQGFLLQTAVALTGDPAPRHGRALLTALIAALLATMGSAAWGCTFGLLVALISKPMAYGLSLLVGLVITSVVYRSRLRLSGGHAFVVAGLHHLMAWAVSGLLWAIIRYWPF